MSERGLPPQVLTEIGSPIRETRLTGVDELTRIAHGSDLAMAAAARHALTRLTEDDSRSVAAAAAAALERTTVRLIPDRIDFGQVAPGTPRLVADVQVDGPPLAVATATVTVSGPGVRAMLAGRTLRIVWMPRSDWLDGSVTVRGPAGWADVRVTGQVTAAVPMSSEAVEARMRAVDDVGSLRAARVTVLQTPPTRRRQVSLAVLIASMTALLLLGGVGVAVAMTMNNNRGQTPLAVAPAVTPSSPPPASVSVKDTPAPPAISKVPLASRVTSVAKPVVIGTIRVGAEPEGVIVSPDGRTVYVANQNSHVLSVVDTVTRKATSVQLRNTPRFVATSRDGKLVFVSMYENDKSGSGVAVVDARTRKVVRNLATGVQPYTLAVGPDGRLWVPIHSARRVEIYTPTDQRPDGEILLPPNPHAVGFSADLMRAFTPNHESNVISIVDMRTEKLLKSIPVSKSPHSIAVSPDGRTVLVAGYDANAADLIDAVTFKRSGPFKVGKQPQSVAFAADGGHGYVVNEGDNTVTVLDGHTGQVTATVKVGRSPRTVGVSPDGRLAYVSNGADNTISILRIGQ